MWVRWLWTIILVRDSASIRELGFLHLYLGLNYLKKTTEGAVIEMRRANQVQEQAKKQREAELESAANDAKKQGVRQRG